MCDCKKNKKHINSLKEDIKLLKEKTETLKALFTNMISDASKKEVDLTFKD